MSDDEPGHEALAQQLRGSIARLREDVEARSDAVLGEVCHALELLLELSTHAHDHAVTNGDRIRALESGEL